MVGSRPSLTGMPGSSSVALLNRPVLGRNTTGVRRIMLRKRE